MRPLYVVILTALFLIVTINLNAQISFVEDTTVPFEGIYGGDAAFADIDGDNDLDVLITGFINPTTRVTKLYTNDGLGDFTLVGGDPFPGLGGYFGEVAFADIDGDNDQDVIFTRHLSISQMWMAIMILIYF